jgi:hypothetical protein
MKFKSLSKINNLNKTTPKESGLKSALQQEYLYWEDKYSKRLSMG